MNRIRFGALARVGILLPTAFAAVVATVIFLAGAGWYHARQQGVVLSEIATRDTAVRAAAAQVAGTVEAVNMRLLGVLADVYAAAGSTAAVEKLFGDLQAAKENVEGLMGTRGQREQLVVLADGCTALLGKKPKIVDALKSAKKQQISQAYDDWIESVVPFRRAVHAKVNELEKHAGERISGMMTSADAQVTMTFVLGAIAGIIALLAGTYVVRGVVAPIKRLTGAMGELAKGRLDTVIPDRDRRDEIGTMTNAVQVFKDSMIDAARLRDEQAVMEQRAAEERLAAENNAQAERKQAAEREDKAAKEAMHQLVNDFQRAIGSVIDTVASAATELEASAGTLTGAASSTEERVHAVAAAAEEASSNVQAVSSATEQMTASIGEVSKQVQMSSEIAHHAVEQAGRTDARISHLSNAANRIGDVVKLITAIAEQTNLLALNATIEAARAGEAGKGFAVVAQEVKQLASQTAKATGEIGSQVAEMQAATRDSVAAIKEIGDTIGRISHIATTIASAVEQQDAATREIARNVESAAHGTSDVSSNIADVSQHANNTGAAATQMLGSAQSLSREGNRLKQEMEQFLHVIRTQAADRRKHDDPNYHGPERRLDRSQMRAAG